VNQASPANVYCSEQRPIFGLSVLHFPMEHVAMRQQSFPRVRIAAIATAIASLLPLSVFGQTEHRLSQPALSQPSLAAAVEAQAAQAAAAPAGPVRRISIDDAVKLALEQNLGIQIQRMDPQIQDLSIAQAKSFWAPSVSSTIAKNNQTQAVTSALSGGHTSVLNSQFSGSVGLSQTLPWGGAYTASWNSARLSSTNIFSNFSPQLSSTLNLQYQQPLLRNLSMDSIRQQVALSKKSRDLSDINLESVVTLTARNVRDAYWDLSYAINNLKAQQESLALSQQSLKDNQKRVEIGTMAPIDIVQAQAEVASNESGVIVAEASIRAAQDQLRALILDPGEADFWDVTLEPTDEMPFNEQTIDVDAAVRNALDKRTDLRSAKNSLDQGDINIRYFNNQIKPDVNAQFGYITTGVGGTALNVVNPLIPTEGGLIVPSRGFGSVLGDVFQSAYPNWTVGLQVAYPLGSSTAQANLARTKLQYQEAQVQMKNLQMQVVLQVRNAGRNVVTDEKVVQSARASRELQEKKLEAEQKKLAAGMSTSFFVFQAQRDLSAARVSEIQAISAYNKSLVDFEAVQQVPLTGSAGITTAGSGAIQSGGIVRTGGS
jgi:outer membrane protein